MPALKYKHKQLKTFITLWKYFRMLRDPLAVKKTCDPLLGQKYLQNPKNQEPLDLSATVGQSCV